MSERPSRKQIHSTILLQCVALHPHDDRLSASRWLSTLLKAAAKVFPEISSTVACAADCLINIISDCEALLESVDEMKADNFEFARGVADIRRNRAYVSVPTAISIELDGSEFVTIIAASCPQIWLCPCLITTFQHSAIDSFLRPSSCSTPCPPNERAAENFNRTQLILTSTVHGTMRVMNNRVGSCTKVLYQRPPTGRASKERCNVPKMSLFVDPKGSNAGLLEIPKMTILSRRWGYSEDDRRYASRLRWENGRTRVSF
ncbi:uncharacterized protein M421DRAFT_90743 [Didymella exigua CBS 183.55]|uniref:Uncharacterized protein n=1 Tax=Didymella exigua CBS 183.55 TaxID=1150837 RepID=A0A6A5S0C8_9PLEO|nr:uncharacterized protein M421DRAFT_90743 [Didymella exigua CBS 183.55]KAF1930967.1 hypothetical protein M421DRAFT_90743 [Didymella exigua CBS 183.55]